MISSLAVGLALKTHGPGSGRLFEGPAVCAFWITQLLASFTKFPDLICSPSNDPEKHRQIDPIKGGVCLKATLSSLYTLGQKGSSLWPLLHTDRGSTPWDRPGWETDWVTERNFWNSLSFDVLMEFCVKSPRGQMLRKCFLPEEGHLLPHVDGGHCKLDSLQPQNHEEPLAEGAVAHVLTIVSSLKKGQRIIERRSRSQTNVQPMRQ